ncbi:MAG: C39 family peptidase [Ruminococcus sp.]|nr:C39 family peptidase [Ruminococcus sp.]
MKLKNKYKWNKLVIVAMVIMFVLSNMGWLYVYNRQRTRIKNALIPTLTDDYYLNQIALTKYSNKFVYEYQFGEESDNSSEMIIDVPLINQNPSYPNGCEAASATMLLNYYGIDITLEEFINYLPKDKVYKEDGTRYGPNPALYYAGNPSDKDNGWGCFDIVIAKTITSILNDYKSSLKVVYQNNKSNLSTLISDAPALIWVTTDYEEVSEVFTWQSYDKKVTYTYPLGEHVVVLTGSDDNYYYINDPLKDIKNIKVPKEQLEKCYDSLGRQFVLLKN